MTATLPATHESSAERPAQRAVSLPRARRQWLPSRALPSQRLFGLLLLLALWSAASASGLLASNVLSAPWTVVETAIELIADGRLQTNLRASAVRVSLGLTIGTTLGLLLALIAGLSRAGEALLDGPLQIKRSVPTLALIPLFILWFGIGEAMKLITISLAVLLPVYLHTHAALRAIDARYVELAQTVRLSRAQFIRRIALPGSLPGFLMGVRLALTAAWLSLVVVEQINATSGIGYMMSLARSYGQTEIIVVGIAIYGLLGLFSDSALGLLERKALTWRRTLAS
jgi:sulfonate transport system permease protein